MLPSVVFPPTPSLMMAGFALNVDLNAIADTAIPLILPSRLFRINSAFVRNKGTTASLTTARAGIFTAAAGGGVGIFADQVLSGLTSNALNTAGALLAMTGTVVSAVYDVTTLYFRVGTAQGADSTGDVFIFVNPLYNSLP